MPEQPAELVAAADLVVREMRQWAEYELDRRIFAHRKTREHVPDDLALDALSIVMLGTHGSTKDALSREQLALILAAAINRLVGSEKNE